VKQGVRPYRFLRKNDIKDNRSRRNLNEWRQCIESLLAWAVVSRAPAGGNARVTGVAFPVLELEAALAAVLELEPAIHSLAFLFSLIKKFRFCI